MKSVVVDTSVIIKWLNQDNEQHLDKADQILLDVEKGKTSLLAPELAKYEIGNVLLKGKRLLADQVEICLRTFYALPITYISETEVSAQETFSLADKLNITYYDAAFLTIANYNNALLVTDNLKHQGRSSKIKVAALKNYKI